MDKSIRKEPIGNGINIAVSSHHIFGTDAILLSHFANATKKDKAIDLGTGCGIIPFLWLRDSKCRSAFGVDISPEAIELCFITKAENNFDNFTAVCSDLNDLKGKVPFGESTLVTCNPPYKKRGAGIKNPDSIDAAARHEVFCTLKDIVAVSAKLLQTGGRLCMCQRPERLAELITLMHEFKVEPKRLQIVAQRPGEKPWLFLVEGKRCAAQGINIEPTFYIEKEKGVLSDEMIAVYGSYKEEFLK